MVQTVPDCRWSKGRTVILLIQKVERIGTFCIFATGFFKSMDIEFNALLEKNLPFASQIDGFLSKITWLVPDGSFINGDSPLCTIKIYYSNEQLGVRNRTKTIEVTSPVSGYLDIKYEYLQSWKKEINLTGQIYKNNVLCRIIQSDVDDLYFLRKYENLFKYRIENDAYTGRNEIFWEDIFGHPVNWIINDNILFELKRIGDDDCLLFKTKERLDVGTKISFLFTDGTITSFCIYDRPLRRIEKDTRFIIKFILYEKELLDFATKELKSCRVDYQDGDYKVLFSFPMKYSIWSGPGFNSGMFFCLWFRTYMKAMKETIPDWQPKQSPVPESQNNFHEDSKDDTTEQVFVYLMTDKNTGLYKIGISKDPKYRERTLQSEKPTIDLICNKGFPNRKVAQAIESALHSLYGNKRIRGEWFNLDEQDVLDIINTLQ